MKKLKTAFACSAICFAFFGVSKGAVVVRQTVATYTGTCSSLDGFPGLLQSTGFIPRGDCREDAREEGQCLGNACTVEGKRGHCVPVKVDEHKRRCVCRPNRTSE